MIKAAILGFGTVGSGVAEVIDKNSAEITKKTGLELSVKYIVDVRDFPGNPYEKLIVKDFSTVENDPEVAVVVETIGGARIAYDFTKRALAAGKSVVTSNKELVATHGVELLKLAEEHGVNYLFEASVGGGIPVLRPLTSCLAANEITEIYGILNGTTNYILTQMVVRGISFDEALGEAQANGYAERDPSADIEGYDACRKICILAALATGKHISPDVIPTEGITGVTLEDVACADKLGYKIKLLGRAVMADGKLCAYVALHLLPKDDVLAAVKGVMNGIVIKGNAVGEVMFYGPGAGKLPTASAVAADVIDAAKHPGERRKRCVWTQAGEADVTDAAKLISRWYVRAERKPSGAAPVVPANGGETAFITEPSDRAGIESALAGCGVKSLFRVME